jgi:hypothetical protein
MFVERQTGPVWLRVLGVVAAATLVVTAVVLVQGIGRAWGTPSAGVLAVALVVLFVIVGLAAVTGLLNRITVTVGDGRVVGRLAPFRVFTIPVDGIAGIEQAEVTTAEAGGIGYRLRPGARFLLFDAGAAARLDMRDGRTYCLRSDRGPELEEAIAGARLNRD